MLLHENLFYDMALSSTIYDHSTLFERCILTYIWKTTNVTIYVANVSELFGFKIN